MAKGSNNKDDEESNEFSSGLAFGLLAIGVGVGAALMAAYDYFKTKGEPQKNNDTQNKGHGAKSDTKTWEEIKISPSEKIPNNVLSTRKCSRCQKPTGNLIKLDLCNHSICLNCFQATINSDLMCPECGTKVSRPREIDQCVNCHDTSLVTCLPCGHSFLCIKCVKDFAASGGLCIVCSIKVTG